MKKLLTFLAAAIMLPVMASDFPAGSPKFGTDYKAALETAKKEGKPVVLVFSAAWCPPCQAMKKTVYPSAEVKPLQDKFVWAYLDTDVEANAAAAEKYQVQGIPHVQFLDKDGKALISQVGGVSAAEFAGILNKVAEKAK
ncbi:MAG: thioredoxin family protein [Verrucomicrobiota bacterium]